MNVSIDSAGRVVVPKRIREQLGFSPETPLELDVVDGHLELHVHRKPAKLVDGPYGPSITATGTSLTDEGIRSTLEAVRERR